MYFYIYLFPIRKNCDLFTHTSQHTPSLLGNFFFLTFFYELIKDQSIEKKLYYYSVGVCVCAWLCVFFGVRACECSSVSFFFLNYFPTSKKFFLTGCLWFVRDKNHITFFCCPKPVCLFSCCSPTSPNGILSFWQIFDCLKLDSGLVVFYIGRENDVF